MSRTLDGVGAVGVRRIRKTKSGAKASRSRVKKAPVKIQDLNAPKAVAARARGGIQRVKA